MGRSNYYLQEDGWENLKKKFSIFDEIRKAFPITTVVPLESLSGYDTVKEIWRKSSVSRVVAFGVALFNKEARRTMLTGAGLRIIEKLVQAQDKD